MNAPAPIAPTGPVSARLIQRARAIRERPNPIVLRELRQTARLPRTPVLVFVAVLAMTLLMGATAAIVSLYRSPAETGAILFQLFYSLSYFVVMICGPAMAANSLANEHEGKTWEALQLTGISPGEIARGKFFATFTNLTLYVVALAPIGSVPFLFGGVTPMEIVAAYATLALIALIAVAFGLSLAARFGTSKGALALTVVLSLPFSIITFLIFGLGLSYAAHDAWPAVDGGSPIWLPVALTRAPVSAPYFLFLVLLPVLAFALPAWFFYESTISAITSYTDDRSFRLKRWFVCTLGVVAAAGSGVALALGIDARADAATGAMVVVLLLSTFAVLVFAGDPVGPSRRVLHDWARTGAGRLRRFLGPGVMRSAWLLLAAPLLTLGLIALVSAASLYLAKPPKWATEVASIGVFVGYAVGFWTFVVGLAAVIRSRTQGPAIPRVVTAGVMAVLAIVPSIFCGFASVFSSASRAGVPGAAASLGVSLIGAPSPFFAFQMQKALTRPDPMPELLAGFTFSGIYLLIGLTLLALAASKSRAVIHAHEAALLDAERRLAEEDARAVAERAARAT